MAAIMSINLRCCRSKSAGNRRCASGASSKIGCKTVRRVFGGPAKSGRMIVNQINLFRRHYGNVHSPLSYKVSRPLIVAIPSAAHLR